MIDIRGMTRVVPDFPKPGIGFFDVTTVLKNGPAYRQVIDLLYEKFKDIPVDKIAGVEARGFAFASPLAYKMGAGMILIRKPGKLPAATIRKEYDLEYGTDAVEMHRDAVVPGENILVIDDLLATGGTVSATCSLIEQAGGNVAGIGFMIELDFLHGREKMKKYELVSLVHIEDE